MDDDIDGSRAMNIRCLGVNGPCAYELAGAGCGEEERCRRAPIEVVEYVKGLERDVKYWQRMYECAQNANSYRQSAIDGMDL